MAPHIRKATRRRQEALDAIRQATGDEGYEEALAKFTAQEGLATEMHFIETGPEVRICNTDMNGGWVVDGES